MGESVGFWPSLQSAPKRQDSTFAGSRSGLGEVPPRRNPTPSHLLAPLLSPRPSVSPFPPPGLVLPPSSRALPPLAFILLSPPLQPPFSSSSPLLSSPLPPAPPLGSPSRRTTAFISGFPARGRQRLVGGSSAVAGAAKRGPSDRGRSAPATTRTVLPPVLRTAAALRVPAPDPPPPHPARLCRLFQRPSLLSGRRCRCRRRRRHRARFLPRPPSAVQGPSVPAPGPRLPASPGPGTMSEKSVEAAAELSAKVRAGTAAARTPHDSRAPRGRAPQAAPDGPMLPWRRVPVDPSPPSPRSPAWRCLPDSARHPPAPSSFSSAASGPAWVPTPLRARPSRLVRAGFPSELSGRFLPSLAPLSPRVRFPRLSFQLCPQLSSAKRFEILQCKQDSPGRLLLSAPPLEARLPLLS